MTHNVTWLNYMQFITAGMCVKYLLNIWLMIVIDHNFRTSLRVEDTLNAAVVVGALFR